MKKIILTMLITLALVTPVTASNFKKVIEDNLDVTITKDTEQFKIYGSYYIAYPICVNGYLVLVVGGSDGSTNSIQIFEERDGNSVPMKCK